MFGIISRAAGAEFSAVWSRVDQRSHGGCSSGKEKKQDRDVRSAEEQRQREVLEELSLAVLVLS